jgi:hypothetical protein
MYLRGCYVKDVGFLLCERLEKLGVRDYWTGYVDSCEVKTMTIVSYSEKTGEWYWTLSGFVPSGVGYIDCGSDLDLFFDLVKVLVDASRR